MNKLPWVEKYRPQYINEILNHSHIKNTFLKYLKYQTFPHLLFYGPSGTGKTSTIKAFAKQFYGNEYNLMVLEINASEERGIEIVRSKIKDFVITTSNFFDNKNYTFKLVILDEADAMTTEAQAMLRRVIEIYTNNARFCLICNYKSKIIDALQSRCTIFKFPSISKKNISLKLQNIAEINNITITNKSIDLLFKMSKGDMRKLLNIFQSLYMINNNINKKFITHSMGYPNNDNINYIIKILKGPKLYNNINLFSQYIEKYGFSLSNIIIELTHYIYKNIITNKISFDKSKFLIKELHKIELNLCNSPNVKIQIYSIVSIFYLIYN